MAQDVQRIRILAVARREDLERGAVGQRQPEVTGLAVDAGEHAACSASFGPTARAASSALEPAGSSSTVGERHVHVPRG